MEKLFDVTWAVNGGVKVRAASADAAMLKVQAMSLDEILAVEHQRAMTLILLRSYEEPQRMKLKLEISVDNDAFLYGDGEEMSRILATVARMFNNRSELRHDRTMIRDSNGNRIGWFEVK